MHANTLQCLKTHKDVSEFSTVSEYRVGFLRLAPASVILTAQLSYVVFYNYEERLIVTKDNMLTTAWAVIITLTTNYNKVQIFEYVAQLRS